MDNFWESVDKNSVKQSVPQQTFGEKNNFNIQELMKFAGQMQGKNTEQMVYEYMRKNGIGNDQLTEVMGIAKQVMPMLKNFGIFK